MIFYTCFQNHFNLLYTNSQKSSRLWYCQITSLHDIKFSLETYFFMRPKSLARRDRCLLQIFKFSTQCKVASKVIPSIKSILIFLNKTAICYSTFSLTCWIYLQLLNRSYKFTSSVVATSDGLYCFSKWASSIYYYNCFLYVPSGLTK